MPAVTGAATDTKSPGVLGLALTSLPAVQTQEGAFLGLLVGVKGDGGGGVQFVSPPVPNISVWQGVGVYGTSADSLGSGVFGENTGGGKGVFGSSDNGDGVHGKTNNGNMSGVVGENTGGGKAGYFVGNVQVNGGLRSDANIAKLAGVHGTHSGWVAPVVLGPDPVPQDQLGGPAVAVLGESLHDGTGVLGTSESGKGVFGSSDNGDGVHGRTSNGNMSGVVGENTGGGKAGYFVGPVQVDGDHTVNGTVHVKTDVILTGADCAEEFDVDSSLEIDAGTVMVVVEGGALQPSATAYDRRVAGVISGAGEYRPGLILDRRASSDGRLPIALVGKVYCKVDADHGAIEVGDLLTTSPTPSHAMRANDPARAFGAVLGKALQSLRAGRGMIPILVALQ